MNDYKVNTIYPGKVPDRDTAYMTFKEEGGLTCVCTSTGINRTLIDAFESNEITCGLFEYMQRFPIALFIFRFPHPLGDLLFDFNILTEKIETQGAFLRDYNYPFEFYLVDRRTKKIKSKRSLLIDPSLLSSLRSIATKQLLHSDTYSYKDELALVYSKFQTALELWTYARKFKLLQDMEKEPKV
jgi:hypothetical protein